MYNPNDQFPYSSSLTRLGVSWITVTHVCHRWRQVALSDPNLWKTVVFDLGAEWAEEMLARSKATLIFYSRCLLFLPRVWKRMSIDDEVTLRKHLSHIRRLVLSGTRESLAPAVRAFNTPAPHLESLELPWNGTQSRESCITLPSDLFAHNAPKLRHVTLSDCAVPWDSPLFRDLTHLDIRVPPVITFPAPSDLLSIPTLERLLDILEAMPSLQVLTLGNCLPRPESTSRVVPLRHMSKLSLDGSLSEIVAVVQRVSLPGSTSLSLGCLDDNSPDRLDTLVSLLASHFRMPETPTLPLSTIVIYKPDYIRSLIIKVWDMGASLHEPEFKPSSLARLRLSLTFGPARFKALVESLPLQICKALPLRDLQTLSITCPGTPWSVADWVDVCIHCPKVAHLHVRRSWAFTLIPTLIERNVFPSLVTLALQDINFFDSLSPEHKEPLGDALLVTLRARRNAGIPVQCVNLMSCALTDRWVESFKWVVDDVVLDSDQGDESDSRSSSTFDRDYDSWSDEDE